MSEDQIFEDLKAKLIEHTRLLKRFYGFCLAYQDFEFDEMGLNTDDAENEKRKALKIKDKLIGELNRELPYEISDNSTEVLQNKIELILQYNINESKKTVKFILRLEEDSFTLEIE